MTIKNASRNYSKLTTQKINISIVLCDHQARDLLACVDTAAIIHNCKIVAQDTPSELIKKI